MAYVLGLDVGTSYTAAAILRLGTETGPQPLRLGSRHDAVPSVVFLPDDGPMLVGEAAERRGLGQPDRMVREFKRRIGDSIPIVAGTAQVRAEDLLAAMAVWVVARAAELEGEMPSLVALAHPVGWGSYKTGLVQAALERAGLPGVNLIQEPVAAARHYASQERVEPGAAIAVYDLGGGTFDVAVLRTKDDGRFTLLGRPEGLEELGGRDFDDAVFRHVLESIGDRTGDLDPEDHETAVALTRLRRECVEAKEALSFDSEATVPVLLPGLTTQVRLLRSEFEALIEDRVEETIAALRTAAENAEVGVDGLATVLLVGGSSRVPLVAELISSELGRPVAIDVDPKAAIALGATAFAAAQLAPAPAPAALRAVPALESEPSAAAPRFAPAITLPSRATRGRILILGAAAVAALLVFLTPPSQTATSTGIAAAESAAADTAEDPAAETQAPAAAAPEAQAPAAAPVDAGDPTPDLFTSPNTRANSIAPNASSRPAPRQGGGSGTTTSTAGAAPASSGTSGAAPTRPATGTTPVTQTPPQQQPPAEEPPVEEPPVEEPPVEEPPVEEPPVEEPPVEEPPVEEPPVEEPPVEEPPVEEPPVEEPPAEEPPVEEPPTDPVDGNAAGEPAPATEG
ncbi:Hsp70 family protein [Naasia sp. SYSU D00948]|uniref:Hsp70 family protein n=1 Tax=Naasia sp. SYSU D00948 TaxID=2817379 RepID=UPI001B30FECF|nr:Hsp70 family protein [Naasia sp. SYSU D00948]